jgi:NAD(P)-dependent dehydrogenase (short-subunit alcohol dehydrogenase family)
MNSYDLGLENKVVIITGAARGIGKAMLKVFLESGAKVAGIDLDEEELKKTILYLNSGESNILGIKADVSNKKDVEEMVTKVIETFGTLDVLINNAAIEIWTPVMSMKEKGWDKLFDVNVKGCYLCSQAVSTIMIGKRSGAIINIASLAGILADKYNGAYASSKAAVMQLSRAMAGELAKHNIRVNCIAPGIIRTRMADSVFKNEETKKRYERIIPLGRIAEPEEIASVALFLSSGTSSYITGATIIVDGGVSISGMNPDETEKTMLNF